MKAIGKRFLNILTALCVLFFGLLVVLMVTGNVSDWDAFLTKNFGALFLAFVGIATANYILFGVATLWHKSGDSAGNGA